jgi:DNA repair protein RadC
MIVRYQRAELPLKLDGPAAARDFFSGCFAEQDEATENLWVAHLDAQCQCVHLSRHEGDAGGVEFPIRRIIGDAALHGSAAILLAHNHPSGNLKPSDADLRATRRLVVAADALGCTLVDHLVFARGECISLRVLGYV